MEGRADAGWALIESRIQTTGEWALWRVALAGQRIEGRPMAALPDWIVRNKLQEAASDFTTVLPPWLNAHAFVDRLPSAPDAEQRKAMAAVDRPNAWAFGLRTARTAIEGRPDAGLTALSEDFQSAWFARQSLLPLFCLDVWNASGGAQPALAPVREQPLGADPSLALSKAVLAAADGHREDALHLLATARYDLGRYGTPHSLHDEMRIGPYDFVLSAWLMSRKTGEPAYAQQGLALARAYQRVQPYMSWPYAAEALLSGDSKAREIAACRAQRLDGASMFLRESGLHPDPKSAACRKATAW